MDVKLVLALPEDLEVEGIERMSGGLVVTVISTQLHPCCPLCGIPAQRFHSRYMRRVSDLPCGGQQVQLWVVVRKCFCDGSTCARKIFAERLAPFIEPWARVTARLHQIVQTLGFATSGMLGARLAERLGIQTCWMTILRRMMAMASPPVEQVFELGLDDFSFKRGRKFGTILVDMRSHQVIDVLPDRSAETAAAWMANHPEIELVSRDRGADYASAATLGAPQAVQCADRFHLIKNLGEALEGLLARHLAAQRKRQSHTLEGEKSLAWQQRQARRIPPSLQQLQQARREERKALYEQVIALHTHGMSQAAIAQRLDIGHSTVSNWLAAGHFPERKRREQASRIDRYLPYIAQRWAEGCHNIARLFREVVDQGYKGSYESVRGHILRFLPEGRKNPSSSEAGKPALVVARQATFLFLRRREDLKVDEQEMLTQIRLLHEEVDVAYELVQQFTQMLRTRTGERLDDWLSKVRSSGLDELESFVAGIERDKAAVLAGLTLAQNNGVVEGKVNKLKLIKRMGYGRAGFPLLRQRVLHAL